MRPLTGDPWFQSNVATCVFKGGEYGELDIFTAYVLSTKDPLKAVW
jgi:hypothetical protein